MGKAPTSKYLITQQAVRTTLRDHKCEKTIAVWLTCIAIEGTVGLGVGKQSQDRPAGPLSWQGAHTRWVGLGRVEGCEKEQTGDTCGHSQTGTAVTKTLRESGSLSSWLFLQLFPLFPGRFQPFWDQAFPAGQHEKPRSQIRTN